MSQLKQRLGEAEAERDKLLEELRGGHGVETSDSDDLEEMFDFSGMRCVHVSKLMCQWVTSEDGIFHFSVFQRRLQINYSRSAPKLLRMKLNAEVTLTLLNLWSQTLSLGYVNKSRN